MTKITTPYNFVPINDKVYTPDWGTQASQDKPFEDGEDGIIEVTLKNISPLFVRNGHTEEEGKSKKEKESIVNFSAFIGKLEDKEKQYFIPGTTIKGMLRSTLEIMSFGKMTQYHKNRFGYRDLGGKDYKESKGYVADMANVEAGWLVYDRENESYSISPCVDGYKTITLAEVKSAFPKYDKNRTSLEKNEAIAKNGYRYPYLVSDDGYRVVCTGAMNFSPNEKKNKQHEYLFSAGDLPEEVDNAVIDTFKKVYQRTPKFDEYAIDYLRKGDSLPVFFKRNKQGDITTIGISKMYKLPYKHSISDGVHQTVAPDQMDLCETIFGFISGDQQNTAYKGRVQVGHAFAQSLLPDPAVKTYVLGEPGASFFPMYLKQNPEKQLMATYNDSKIEIAGRKRYRIHPKDSVLPEEFGNGNKNTQSHLRPLPPGQSFTLKIHVHNMRPIEIGALISALTLHQTKGVYHNIGQAKAFGYGKVIATVDNLKFLAKTPQEYMAEFEMAMNDFCVQEYAGESCWIEHESIQRLFGIASDNHNPEDLVFMDIQGGYKVSKNNSSKDQVLASLQEHPVNIQSQVSTTFKEEVCARKEQLKMDRFREEYIELYNEMEALIADNKYSDALNLVDKLRKIWRAQPGNMQDSQHFEELERRIHEYRNAYWEKLDAIQANNAPKKDEGLSFLQDAKADFDKQYRRIDQWMAKKNEKEASFLNEQVLVLHDFVLRCAPSDPTNLNKKDKKKWGDDNNAVWSKLSNWIGVEAAMQWKEEWQNRS